MTRRFGRALPAFVAAIFLFSCLATMADLAMAEDEGCQAIEPSVRICGPATALDTVPALPALAVSFHSSLAPTAWVAVTLPLIEFSEHQIAPSVPRSPPSHVA